MKLAICIKKFFWKHWMWLVLILILIGFLVLTAFVDSKSAIGMIGITVGALISGFFSYFINETNYKKQLRLAALDKRLEAHQQAFTLWSEIVSNIYEINKINDVIQKSEIWWLKNCLYLGPKSRSAFHACLLFAGNHSNLCNASIPKHDNKIERHESWKIIMLPGKTLVEEMELPNLNEDEFLKRKNKEAQ